MTAKSVCLNLIKPERIWRANKSRKFLHRAWSFAIVSSHPLAPSSELQSRSCVKFGRQKLFCLFRAINIPFDINFICTQWSSIASRTCDVTVELSQCWHHLFDPWQAFFLSAVVGFVMPRLTFIDNIQQVCWILCKSIVGSSLLMAHLLLLFDAQLRLVFILNLWFEYIWINRNTKPTFTSGC